MKIQKVKLRGHSRRVYALAFVIVFALAGTGYLLYSRAATGVLGIWDSGVAMKANTSPSLNGDVIAFNDKAWSEMRFRYYSPAYGGNQAYGTAVRPVLPILDGTNPTVSGNFISYQSNLGTLQYYNWTTGKNVDTTQIVKAGTSPCMFGDNIAYISTTGTLRYYNITTGKMVDTNQAVLPGTNPAISGDLIAFQSAGTTLTFWKISAGQLITTNQGMRANTSPSISGDMAAFQANTTVLYYWKISTAQSFATNQGMMAGTSPSISGSVIAFQANTSALYYWNTSDRTSTNTGQYMATTTSPALLGNIIAFQGSNTNLIYYTLPNIPPPPTVTLTGPTSVNQGNGATLIYKTTNTNHCEINNGGTFDPTQSLNGEYFANYIPATTTYTITCQGSGGVIVSASWTVQAVGPPSGGITGPATVAISDAPTLTISTANVANCTVNGATVSPNGTYTAPAINAYTTYELKCGGADGTGTALIASTAVSAVPIAYNNYVKSGAPDLGQDPNPTATASSTGPSGTRGYYHVEPFIDLRNVNNVAYGMSADILTATPRVNGLCDGGHSLAQVGVHNRNGKNNMSIVNGVEFGWVVGCSNIQGDERPRLFVENVINGYGNYTQGTTHGWINCCGFVSTSSLKPGHVLQDGSLHNYKVAYSSNTGRWNLYFDGKLFGYYNAANFKKYSGYEFTHADQEAAWGEVYQPGGRCIQMGSGKRGGEKGAAYINNIKVNYSGGWTKAYLYYLLVENKYNYSFGDFTGDGFTYGGNGIC